MHAAFGEQLLLDDIGALIHAVAVSDKGSRFRHRCLANFPSQAQMNAYIESDVNVALSGSNNRQICMRSTVESFLLIS